MRFWKEDNKPYPRYKVTKVFLIIPKFLEDTKEYAWFEGVYRVFRVSSSGFPSEISIKYYSENPMTFVYSDLEGNIVNVK